MLLFENSLFGDHKVDVCDEPLGVVGLLLLDNKYWPFGDKSGGWDRLHFGLLNRNHSKSRRLPLTQFFGGKWIKIWPEQWYFQKWKKCNFLTLHSKIFRSPFTKDFLIEWHYSFSAFNSLTQISKFFDICQTFLNIFFSNGNVLPPFQLSSIIRILGHDRFSLGHLKYFKENQIKN